MSAMKLQKLLYYCQAWYAVWHERRLFNARIEAWANGPVIRSVYDVHKGDFKVSKWPLGDSGALTDEQKRAIRGVIKFYGPKTAQWLSDLTHREDPWRLARRGLGEGERGNSEITLASMHEYYSSIAGK